MAHSRQEDEQLFRVLITSLCVVDHPEMQLAMGRKDSTIIPVNLSKLLYL